MMALIFKSYLIGLLACEALLCVRSIGRPRVAFTPGDAALLVALNGLMIAGICVWL